MPSLYEGTARENYVLVRTQALPLAFGRHMLPGVAGKCMQQPTRQLDRKWGAAEMSKNSTVVVAVIIASLSQLLVHSAQSRDQLRLFVPA